MEIPKFFAEKKDIRDGHELEVHIRNPYESAQTDLWGNNLPDDNNIINKISFSIPSETMTMNMHSKIYIPVKYRFFFPPSLSDFILETNAGNIQTHINHDGYIVKGMKPWFIVNPPLEEKVLLAFSVVEETQHRYKLEYCLAK